jgi:hypothetical protein
MGFDTKKPVFHGSAKPFDKFDNSMLGSNTGASDASIGHHFAGDRSDADLYATMAAEKLQQALTGDGYGATGHIGEYLVRSKNPLIVDDFDSPLLDKFEALNVAKQNKNDSIIYPYGTNVDSAYTQVVFEPENVRLKNAAFDPWRKTAATAAAFGVADQVVILADLGVAAGVERGFADLDNGQALGLVIAVKVTVDRRPPHLFVALNAGAPGAVLLGLAHEVSAPVGSRVQGAVVVASCDGVVQGFHGTVLGALLRSQIPGPPGRASSCSGTYIVVHE